MRSLRTRLILSHILPLLIIIPLIGVILGYMLETQLVLTNLSQELEQQALLTAQIAANESDIWENSAQARMFIARFESHKSEIKLVDRNGNLVASNNPNDAELIGQPQELPALPTVLAGKNMVQTTYTFNLQANVVEVMVPVPNNKQEMVGAIQLTQQLADVYDNLLKLRYTIAGVTAGALVLAVIAGLVLALNLERPIHDATQAIHDIAGGREWNTLPEQGPEEIRLLARAVNTLTERLRVLEDARRRLLANIVHEVGRPIGAIQAAIQALLNGADQDNAMRRELLEGMQAEVNRLHPLLDNLTELHDQVLGTLELNPQSIKLSEWLTCTIAPWREAAQEKGLRWQVDIPLSLPTLTIDPDRIAQVLGNLLSNAIKYTPTDGSVSIIADVKDEQVWIEVRDTGPGLSDEEKTFIFEPFYRSQPGRRFPQGMGLGLTIAQDLIVAHHGRLEIESQLGHGSTFTLWLPLNNPQNQDKN